MVPADRDDPKMRSLETSREDLLRQSTISFPTAPVAPTTPTEYDMEMADEVFLDMKEVFVVLKECLAFAILLVCFTNEMDDDDDDGLNPNAVDAVDTARKRVADVLNFIWERFFDYCVSLEESDRCSSKVDAFLC